MDVSSISLPLSNLILSSEGFEKHDDTLPTIVLGPQLLYASSLNADDGSGDKPDNITVPFEGDQDDNFIDEDGICPYFLFFFLFIFVAKTVLWSRK